MDVLQRLIDALDNNRPNSTREFGGQFYIEKRITRPSQQGLVVIASNAIGKKFAIKFYQPSDMNIKLLKMSEENFIREVKIGVTLRHRNIVDIISGGRAIWNNEGAGRWEVTSRFENDKEEYTGGILYYVMDYIEGQDISSIFVNLGNTEQKKNSDSITPIKEQLRLFEQMTIQVCSAMDYYLSKEITHGDIKLDNILYSPVDDNFVVVDFGFAHHFDSPLDPSIIVRTEKMDTSSITSQDETKRDLAQFSLVLLDVLPTLKNEYDANRYLGIKSAIEKALAPDLEKRYASVAEFCESIKQYFITLPSRGLLLELNETLCPNGFGRFSVRLRIPVSGSILLTEEIRDIVDTPEFQRLRGVRQLGPAIFVFPGANHTRYEHSLGTYHLALRYISKLVNWAPFREVCEPLTESIKLITLAALLHDIGHYSYSHWIEEIDVFPKGIRFGPHEERARTIINSDNIRSFIEDKWDMSADEVADIIANKHMQDPRLRLINSIINSPFDVDKLDYLIRDSVHCGVNYGAGIDVERFLDSICVPPGTSYICLTDKGMSCLLSQLACRNVMYQEIYWHKTVRCCDAMFKRFFYEYIARELDNIDRLQEYLLLPDDDFTGTLLRRCEEEEQFDLVNLIRPLAFRGRRLYKPAFVFHARHATFQDQNPDVAHFFHRVQEIRSYAEMVKLSDSLATVLQKVIPELRPLDVILESTPIRDQHEKYDLSSVQLWNLRQNRLEPYPTLNDLNYYLVANRRSYLFCRPEYYEKIEELIRDTDSFVNILEESLAVP